MIELSAVIASATVAPIRWEATRERLGTASRGAGCKKNRPRLVALSSFVGCSDGFGGGEGYSPGARLGRACAWRAHTAVLGFPSAAAGEPRPSKPPASASRQRKNTPVSPSGMRERKNVCWLYPSTALFFMFCFFGKREPVLFFCGA